MKADSPFLLVQVYISMRICGFKRTNETVEWLECNTRTPPLPPAEDGSMHGVGSIFPQSHPCNLLKWEATQEEEEDENNFKQAFSSSSPASSSASCKEYYYHPTTRSLLLLEQLRGATRRSSAYNSNKFVSGQTFPSSSTGNDLKSN